MIESLTGQGINVRHACRVLDVSESGSYDWKDRPDPPRTLRRIWLAGERCSPVPDRTPQSKTPAVQGFRHAAEWSRTITGVPPTRPSKNWFEGVSVMYDSLRSPQVL